MSTIVAINITRILILLLIVNWNISITNIILIKLEGKEFFINFASSSDRRLFTLHIAINLLLLNYISLGRIDCLFRSLMNIVIIFFFFFILFLIFELRKYFYLIFLILLFTINAIFFFNISVFLLLLLFLLLNLFIIFRKTGLRFYFLLFIIFLVILFIFFV